MTLRSISIVGLCLSVGLVIFAARAGASDRIVSIGGTTTEIVYRLGAGERIVAVDSTSRFPDAATRKPNVGYMRALAAEPIIALAPTLVIADGDAGPKPVLAQLREAGIRVVIAPSDPTPDGVFARIDTVAAALRRRGEGKALADTIRRQLARAKAAVERIPTRPRVLFLLAVGNGGAPMSGGRGTSADAIMRLAGGANAIGGFDGYKPVSPEAIVEAAPDIVLVTSRSLRMLGGVDRILARPAVAATPAGKAGRVVAMDGLLLLGFGPRLGDAIVTLARLLNPGVVIGGAVN